MPKALPTADQVAEKYSRNAGAAGTSLKEGVDRVTDSPMEKAAANVDGYLQGIQKAVAEGKWERNLKKVSLASWKEDMKGKGVSNYISSIPKAKVKMKAAMEKLLPYIAAGQAKVDSMPKLNKSDAKARMNTMFDHMSDYKD